MCLCDLIDSREWSKTREIRDERVTADATKVAENGIDNKKKSQRQQKI